MSAPYSPWRTRSQFKAIEPRPVVVVRLQYQCEAEGQTGTDSTSRLAAGRSRCLPGIRDLFGAVTALRSRFSAPLVQACKQSNGCFTKRLNAFHACVAHAEQHGTEGVGDVGIEIGEFRNV
jgi:hypothetical protein